MTDSLARTPSGDVRGELRDGVVRFLGIPYAAPPVGALRFALPQQHALWTGARDATVRGPIAPQPTPTPAQLRKMLPGLDLQPLIGDAQLKGDDFLVLNIWTPRDATNAPVMVFIHGGGFIGGAGAGDIYDGASFARAGVVCVTINYRLGIEGFLTLPGAPTNLGLRDQIFALQWVAGAIAGFGGDPTNVTVFGESAGGMSIANLMVSPLATGLFERAIIQSGHGDMVRPIDVAERLTDKIAKILRIRPTLEGFKSRAIEDCLDAQRKVSLPTAGIDLRNSEGREPAFGMSRFMPVYGDDVLPEHPRQALARGAGAEVQLMVGTNSEEMNLYFVPSGVRQKIPAFVAHWLTKKSEPKAKDVLRAYGIQQRGKRPGDAFTEALTDIVFRLPARRFAAAHRGRTHVYDFGWRSTAYGGALGACHAIELPFVFNTLSTVAGPRGLAGENPPQALADHMNRLWADFATSGSLPWGEYTAESRLVYHPETGQAAKESPMPAERVLG
ncbi:MAG: carboxylesterase family protein [Pseudomonadota bacterium]